MLFDGFHADLVRALDALSIILENALNTGRRCNILGLCLTVARRRAFRVGPRFAALAQIPLHIRSGCRVGDIIQLLPHFVEPRLLFCVEHEFIQRLIVAEVTHQVVEART